MIDLSISFRGELKPFHVEDDSTIGQFQELVEQETKVPAEFQKLIAPKFGIIKPDKLEHKGDTKVSQVFTTEQSRKKIMLVGTPLEDIHNLQEAEVANTKLAAKRLERQKYMQKHARTPAYTPPKPVTSSVKYTFQKLVPLDVLPFPGKSLDFLRRLRDDKGVQAIMDKYKWSVGILTELDPATNTTHASRLLGRNRNAGQMIELRLRTDDYQGWCNYKEVRKVLCHELAHNVYGEHDRNFWDLCNTLEKQVVDLDPYGHSGRRIGQDVYEGPGLWDDDEGEHLEGDVDDGGWYGSTNILGNTESTSSTDNESMQNKSFRAAEARRNR